MQQQILQQQAAAGAAQLVAAAAGQNLGYNIVQAPAGVQALSVDGQEAIFIPAMSLGNYIFCVSCSFQLYTMNALSFVTDAKVESAVK